jgi:simple sugar transport system permease protein
MVGNTAPGFSPILFDLDIIVFIGVLLVIAVWFILRHTRWGLNLRSVGENPVASDSMGLNVFRIRYAGVIVGGMLSGMSGAYLSLAYTQMWVENMVAGKGWIAIALVIFAVWDPIKALLGSYLFGAVMATILRIQAIGSKAPVYILNMAPYIATILVLVVVTAFEGMRKKMGAPEALGVPFAKEEG